MNTDAEAKDTKYKTDKEKVSETSKGADKETRKEADTPVKETVLLMAAEAANEKNLPGEAPYPRSIPRTIWSFTVCLSGNASMPGASG